jgi:hypothetical protein
MRLFIDDIDMLAPHLAPASFLAALAALSINESRVPVRIQPAAQASACDVALVGGDALLTGLDGLPDDCGVLYLGATLPRVLGTPSGRAFGFAGLAVMACRRYAADDGARLMHLRPQVYSMLEISREGLSEMTDACMQYVRGWPALAVVVSLDVLDPVVVPSAAGVPGGLSSRELFYVAQRVLRIPTVARVVVHVDAADARTLPVLAHLLAECERGR